MVLFFFKIDEVVFMFNKWFCIFVLEWLVDFEGCGIGFVNVVDVSKVCSY